MRRPSDCGVPWGSSILTWEMRTSAGFLGDDVECPWREGVPSLMESVAEAAPVLSDRRPFMGGSEVLGKVASLGLQGELNGGTEDLESAAWDLLSGTKKEMEGGGTWKRVMDGRRKAGDRRGEKGGGRGEPISGFDAEEGGVEDMGLLLLLHLWFDMVENCRSGGWDMALKRTWQKSSHQHLCRQRASCSRCDGGCIERGPWPVPCPLPHLVGLYDRRATLGRAHVAHSTLLPSRGCRGHQRFVRVKRFQDPKGRGLRGGEAPRVADKPELLAPTAILLPRILRVTLTVQEP